MYLVNRADKAAAEMSGLPPMFYSIKRRFGDEAASDWLEKYDDNHTYFFSLDGDNPSELDGKHGRSDLPFFETDEEAINAIEEYCEDSYLQKNPPDGPIIWTGRREDDSEDDIPWSTTTDPDHEGYNPACEKDRRFWS